MFPAVSWLLEIWLPVLLFCAAARGFIFNDALRSSTNPSLSMVRRPPEAPGLHLDLQWVFATTFATFQWAFAAFRWAFAAFQWAFALATTFQWVPAFASPLHAAHRLHSTLLACRPANQVFCPVPSGDRGWYNKSFVHHFLSLFYAFWS